MREVLLTRKRRGGRGASQASEDHGERPPRPCGDERENVDGGWKEALVSPRGRASLAIASLPASSFCGVILSASRASPCHVFDFVAVRQQAFAVSLLFLVALLSPPYPKLFEAAEHSPDDLTFSERERERKARWE